MSGFLSSFNKKANNGGNDGLKRTSASVPADMKFAIQPIPGESGFSQWVAAMKMVAQLPGGIPPEFRRRLWVTMAERHLASRGVDWSKIEKICFSDEWSHPADAELGIQIVKDLHRTGCSLFCGDEGQQNQILLKKVLMAYARWNKAVGYCQGFNMLAALILQVTDKCENDALKLMIYLIEGVLPDSYFADSLRGLSVDMAVFRELLRSKLPRLSKHLDLLQNAAKDGARSYEPPLTNVFTMQWFLTLFCNCLPQPTVLRVWDLIFLEGNEILLRTALAIWQVLAQKIVFVRTADEFYCVMGALTRELLESNLIDANTLIKAIVAIGPLAELKSLREHYLYNITPWGAPMPNKQPTINLHPKQQISSIPLDISALKKQYVKLKQRQRQAHVIFSSAVSSRQTSPASTPVMNHLLVGKKALGPSKRPGPPKGSVPPARPHQIPSTIHWKDTTQKNSIQKPPPTCSSSSSSDTELCDEDDVQSSSEDENTSGKAIIISQFEKKDNLISDSSDGDNIVTIPRDCNSLSPSHNNLKITSDSEEDESAEFESFLADRLKCDPARRNSELAFQIIQENSLILHRIMQCQSRFSPSPPLIDAQSVKGDISPSASVKIEPIKDLDSNKCSPSPSLVEIQPIQDPNSSSPLLDKALLTQENSRFSPLILSGIERQTLNLGFDFESKLSRILPSFVETESIQENSEFSLSPSWNEGQTIQRNINISSVSPSLMEKHSIQGNFGVLLSPSLEVDTPLVKEDLEFDMDPKLSIISPLSVETEPNQENSGLLFSPLLEGQSIQGNLDISDVSRSLVTAHSVQENSGVLLSPFLETQPIKEDLECDFDSKFSIISPTVVEAHSIQENSGVLLSPFLEDEPQPVKNDMQFDFNPKLSIISPSSFETGSNQGNSGLSFSPLVEGQSIQGNLDIFDVSTSIVAADSVQGNSGVLLSPFLEVETKSIKEDLEFDFDPKLSIISPSMVEAESIQGNFGVLLSPFLEVETQPVKEDLDFDFDSDLSRNLSLLVEQFKDSNLKYENSNNSEYSSRVHSILEKSKSLDEKGNSILYNKEKIIMPSLGGLHESKSEEHILNSPILDIEYFETVSKSSKLIQENLNLLKAYSANKIKEERTNLSKKLIQENVTLLESISDKNKLKDDFPKTDLISIELREDIKPLVNFDEDLNYQNNVKSCDNFAETKSSDSVLSTSIIESCDKFDSILIIQKNNKVKPINSDSSDNSCDKSEIKATSLNFEFSQSSGSKVITPTNTTVLEPLSDLSLSPNKSPSNETFNPFPVPLNSRQNKDIGMKLGLYKK